MSLFPVLAILSICLLLVLVIVLVILYFTVFKKNLCCPTKEEGEPIVNPPQDGTQTVPAGPDQPEISVDGTDGATGGGGGGNGGGLPPVVDGGVDPQPGSATITALVNATLPGTPSDRMTLAPPAPSVAGAGDAVSTAGDPVGFEPEEAEPLCVAGKLLIQFTYMPAANKINLTVIRASDIPPVERGGADNIQVHLCVLPMRKQRYRTKAVPASKGVINMTFSFIHMTPDLVEKCAIRLRVYSAQRFSKRLIGEVKVSLAQIDLTSPLADEQIWKNLSPKGLVALFYGIDEEDEPDIDDW